MSADTIRHYENLGVLPAALRGGNDYRRFPGSAVQRVEVIQRALDAGFSLGDIRRVLRVRDSGGAPCRQVYAMAEERLARLEERIRALRAIRDELSAALEEWKVTLAVTPDGERAGLLDSWTARAASHAPSNRERGLARQRMARRRSAG